MYFILAICSAVAFFAFLAYWGHVREKQFMVLVNGLCILALLFALFLELRHLSSREEIIAISVAILATIYADAIFLFSSREKRYSSFYFAALKQLPQEPNQDNFEVQFVTSTRAFLKDLDDHVVANQKKEVHQFWLKALQAIHKNRLSEALNAFRNIDRKFSNVIIKGNIAAALIQIGNTQEGLKQAGNLLREPPTWQFDYNRAVGLMKLRKYKEAQSCFAKLNHPELKSWKVAFYHARVLQKLGHNEAACKLFLLSTRYAPDKYECWYHLALAQSKIGPYEKALAWFDRAACLQASDANLWYHRGNVLAKLGDYIHAIQSYDKALELNPRYILAWNNKGIALNRLGKARQAIRCYRRALSLDSCSYEALLNCALALDHLGYHGKALEFYFRFLQCAPGGLKAYIENVKTRIAALKRTRPKLKRAFA